MIITQETVDQKELKTYLLNLAPDLGVLNEIAGIIINGEKILGKEERDIYFENFSNYDFENEIKIPFKRCLFRVIMDSLDSLEENSQEQILFLVSKEEGENIPGVYNFIGVSEEKFDEEEGYFNTEISFKVKPGKKIYYVSGVAF